ncbi:MAG: N-acetylmuramoyl-L-alanine amidase [Chloroflexota bacterium]|jgi:N-acetyl-anhydromuramyl-L-alanine amidase AmpD|nr:N-acetylmuramoyl-L-alanine amidase [Chloroflexota bacterium]
MGGYLGGCDAVFNDARIAPEKRVSAHFGVALDGRVHQYVRLADTAWANGVLEAGNRWPGAPGVNPNLESISIETEDRAAGATPVSDAQYAAVLALCVAVILPTCPTISMLVAHSVISPHSRPNCPGPRWIASGRFAALAEALGIAAVA